MTYGDGAFEGGNGFEEQIGYRLPVYLHKVGDLFIVHSLEIFKKNSLFLTSGQIVDGGADHYLVFGIDLVFLNFSFDGLVVGKFIYLVQVEQRAGGVIPAKLLQKLISHCFQEIDGNKLDIDRLPFFPDVNQEFLDRIFDELAVGRIAGSVVKQRPVQPVCQLAKGQTIASL